MPVSGENIFSKCLPSVIPDIERCPGPTLCDLSPTTDRELEEIYADERGRLRIIGALVEHDFVGKACQVRTNGMYDWIRATTKELGHQKLTLSPLSQGLWSVMPFVQMLRKGPINNEYWTVSGAVSQGGTVNGVAYDAYFELSSQGGIPNDCSFFPDRQRVFITALTLAGTTTHTAWRVVYCTTTLAGLIRIYVLSENTASNLPAANITFPTGGVLIRGTPNVNDYEKWCSQVRGLNTNQHTPFWIESTRYGFCDNDIVRKYLELIRANNAAYKKFIDVPDVELNRQIIEDFQRRHVNQFFFGKALPNQTMTNYGSLEEIVSYSDDTFGNYLNLPLEGKCIGRRANAVGILEQHAECGQVKDLQGQILNIPELIGALYNIWRIRDENGMDASVIPIYTDSFYAMQLAQGFLAYVTSKGQGMLQFTQSMNAPAKQNALGFYWREFRLEYPPTTIQIVSHKFFDDRVAALRTANPAMENAGRVVWILDWSVNYQGMIESNSVTNRSGTASDLAKVNNDYLCVMKVPQENQKLVSLTYANIAACPAASLLLNNMSSEVPESAGPVGNYGDYYGAVVPQFPWL